jgi:hypothetical protein
VSSEPSMFTSWSETAFRGDWQSEQRAVARHFPQEDFLARDNFQLAGVQVYGGANTAFTCVSLSVAPSPVLP